MSPDQITPPLDEQDTRSPETRARMRRDLDESLADIRAGRVVDGQVVIDRMKKKLADDLTKKNGDAIDQS